MRTVSFIHEFGPEFASFRYRAMIPAQQTGAMLNNPEADILVFSKPSQGALNLAQEAKLAGKTIIADFCDDYFDDKHKGIGYRYLADIADLCVCPTQVMRDRIPARKIAVIPDPYEMEELQPHAEDEKLLWFGHNAGLKALEPYKDLPRLTIVTGPAIMKGMIEYSPEALRKAMTESNIAIFPTTKGHEYKSPNRVINALRMGLFPVCDRHPSYTEFKRFVWQSNIGTGLVWAREFQSELNDLVKAGQDYIRERYSPQTIGGMWKDLLGSI